MGRGPNHDSSAHFTFGDTQFSPPVMATDVPLFSKDKHISYWLRCLRSPLPHHYTAQDANRMTLAFFIVSALDLLGVLFTRTTVAERTACIDWIYRCQHPDGGFRGFPGTDFDRRGNDSNKAWDPANVPATYFALAALAVLGDDLSRVQRKKSLLWLRRMQRPDGSFGETLGHTGQIEGGMDTRFAYTAMIVRWILRGDAVGDVEGVPDVDVPGLVSCIRGSEAYDGGISEAPYHEAHAGFTYCAIGALSVLGRLPKPDDAEHQGQRDDDERMYGLSSYNDTVQWLVSRLTTTIEEEEDDDEESGSDELSTGSNTTESKLESLHRQPFLDFGSADPPWAGFNGRSNKIADTCYAWWVGGSLMLLDAFSLINQGPLRRYLIEKTQHHIAGGFSKFPGAPPDVYHAYLGLAALSIMEAGTSEDEVVLGSNVQDIEGDGQSSEPRVLRRIDPAACFSLRAKAWIEGLSWRKHTVRD